MMLDAVASLAHLKLKYHNVHDGAVTICADLSRTPRVYKALQRDQKGKSKEKAMEINMVYLTKELEMIIIKLLKKKTMDLGKYDANGSDLED